MRALFVTNPGTGHLNPMLPVARALRDAGHEVAFASAPAFAPAIEEAGFEPFSAGLDWLEAEPETAFPECARIRLEERGDWLLRDVFADAAPHRMIRDLLDLGRSWGPELVVRNDYEFGSCVAAELLGIPQATIGISLFWPPSVLEARIGDRLAYLRSAFGLRPYPATDMLYPSLYLTYAPRRFQPRALHVIEAVRNDSDTGPPQDRDPPARPTVYASLGTVFNRTPGIFEAILEGLADEPVNLVATIGRNRDPAELGPVPANVRVERFIPQDLQLARSDLFITHSPFFTLMAALGHGLPLLMIPLAGDQPAHALRARSLGLGLVLRRKGLTGAFVDESALELSAETVRASVRELLAVPRYRENARQMQAEIRALPDLSRAVALLEELAAAGVPRAMIG